MEDAGLKPFSFTDDDTIGNINVINNNSNFNNNSNNNSFNQIQPSRRSVGVFIGCCASDYGQLQTDTAQLCDGYTGTGSALSILANRVSYIFGFNGPSLSVDTACSSSLTALHLAIQSL